MKYLLLILLLVGQIFANIIDDAEKAYNNKDFAKAEKLVKACADKGDRKCAYFLGSLYFEAFTYLKNPINELNALMQKNKLRYDKMAPQIKSRNNKLSFFYDNAIKYLKIANDSVANALIGEVYMNGLSIGIMPIYQPDYKKAKYYFNLALNSDDKMAIALAANDLGLMYLFGNGVLQDYKEAEKYFKKAIENGSINTNCNLGLLYIKKQDIYKAKKYLRIGYEAGAEMCGQIWNEYNLGQ